jgi:hypothetical protein
VTPALGRGRSDHDTASAHQPNGGSLQRVAHILLSVPRIISDAPYPTARRHCHNRADQPAQPPALGFRTVTATATGRPVHRRHDEPPHHAGRTPGGDQPTGAVRRKPGASELELFRHCFSVRPPRLPTRLETAHHQAHRLWNLSAVDVMTSYRRQPAASTSARRYLWARSSQTAKIFEKNSREKLLP